MDLLVIVGLLELVFLLFFFMGMVGATIRRLNRFIKELDEAIEEVGRIKIK